MEPRVLEESITRGDVEEFEKLISYWPDFSATSSSPLTLASSTSTTSSSAETTATTVASGAEGSESETSRTRTQSTTRESERARHIRHAFSYGRLLWTSVHQRTPITKNIVLDPAIFDTPVKLDGILIKLKIFLDLVVALQPATPLANPHLAPEFDMAALAPVVASVAREFAAAHRTLYRNFSDVSKPVDFSSAEATAKKTTFGGASPSSRGGGDDDDDDDDDDDAAHGPGDDKRKKTASPGGKANKKKSKTKTAFGNFFSKLKKDFKKGFTEMQLSVQRMTRDGVDLLQPGAAGRNVEHVQRYRRLLHQLCRGLYSVGHIYRFVLSVKERCDAEDAADKAAGGADAAGAASGGDVELHQSIIAARNDRTQQLRAAAAVVRDIDKISTFFADVVWPLLLKDIITMAKRYIGDQAAGLL